MKLTAVPLIVKILFILKRVYRCPVVENPRRRCYIRSQVGCETYVEVWNPKSSHTDPARVLQCRIPRSVRMLSDCGTREAKQTWTSVPQSRALGNSHAVRVSQNSTMAF